MSRLAHRVRVLHALWICAALLPVLGALPGAAHAACSTGARADSVAAARIVARLRAAGAPGAADASAVLQRARTSCTSLRFARAVAGATQRAGVPAIGRRMRIVGVDLVGVRVAGGSAWRVDLLRTTGRLAATRSARRAALVRRELAASRRGTGSIVWSPDPTRAAWDPKLQSSVASLLARSRWTIDHAVAGASVRAFAPRTRLLSVSRLDVGEHLIVAARAELAARRSGGGSATIANALIARGYSRVRAAARAGWSRTDGHWSTLGEHRVLVTRTRALLVRLPHPATARTVAALADRLRSLPAVRYAVVPSGAFYPWPRDAVLDAQSIALTIDKPAELQLTIYDAAGTAVRRIDQRVEPGTSTIAWDGAAAGGTILGPGEYRYAVRAIDPAGNRLVLAGLGAFEVARDTTPPVVTSASLQYATGAPLGARVVARWNVVEPLSPHVRTTLVLASGATRHRIVLDERARVRAVRRKVRLAAGTWHAAYVFVDGSGNVTTRAAGAFVVR